MVTSTQRKRARLALQMLGKQPEPSVGDHVLIWARIEAIHGANGFKATVVTSICERAFVEQTIIVNGSDIVITTPERL